MRSRKIRKRKSTKPAATPSLRTVLRAFLAAAVFAVLCLTGCGRPLFTPDSGLDLEIRRGMVSEMKALVREHYPFDDLKGGGRIEAFEAELDAVLVASEADPGLSDVGFKTGLRRAVSELRDGHTTLSWYPFWFTPGVRFRYLENGGGGDIYVERRVERNGMPLEPGDRIVSIEGYAAEDLYAEMLNYTYSSNERSRNQTAANFIFSAAYRKLGPSEQTSPYHFSVERAGTAIDLEVTLSSEDTSFVGGAPYAEEITVGGTRAGYIAIPTFRYPGDIDLIDRMINRFSDAYCLILDLRGNGGGNTVAADYLLGRIIPEEPEKYVMKTKDGTVTNRIGPFPRGEIFTGPVYVLTDFLSFSTANYFAERVRNARETGLLPNAVIAGEPTGGGAAEPVSTALTPELTFRVSREVVYSPEGNTYETGVVPDIDVAAELTPADLVNGLALTGFPAGIVDLEHDLTLLKVLEAEGVLP